MNEKKISFLKEKRMDWEREYDTVEGEREKEKEISVREEEGEWKGNKEKKRGELTEREDKEKE